MPDPLEKRFLNTIVRQLVQLPYDMKILFDAITDEELDHAGRVLAAGAAIYILGPYDAINDSTPTIGYVDDVIVLRIAVDAVRRMQPEVGNRLIERFSDGFATLEEDLATYREFLGPAFGFLEGKAKGMSTANYKGHTAREYVDDPEMHATLYEDSLAFTTDYEVDEEKAGRLKKASSILENLQRKMAEERR